MERNVYIENMPLEEAQKLFMQSLEKCGYFTIDSEEIEVLESHGRITSSPVTARRSSPHYIASAMDGIAVKAESTYGANELNPVTLKRDKDFVEVDTGDYIPPGFNAVIMIEDVNFINTNAQVIKPAVPWQHIRSVGEDLVARDMIVTCASRIGPYEIASFLTAAVDGVPVVKKPVVAIIPTGTELCDRGNDNMKPGEIVESNSRMLSGLCREWGAESFRHDIVIDDKEILLKAVREVKDNADMIIICSGSSAGREDYTASIVNELGQLLVHGIATRPGKPAILGIINHKPVIGVPGYPVSAQLIFTLFAKPILYRKQGLAQPEPEKIECRISKKIASSMGVDEFVYVNAAKVKDKYISYPLSRGAGISTSLVKADGILHIKRGHEGLLAGDRCTVFFNRPRYILDKTLVSIGSHDMSIDILADVLQKKYDKRLISTNVGSMGGIMALRRGETHFSGIHLLDYDTGEYNLSYLKKYLPDEKWILVNLVKRQQGLIVKKGNPMHITTLKDLLRPEVRYINRQKGAGTRVLLDYLLNQEDIKTSQINGYNREEYTHLAVAAGVKNDACDTGLGIYASAKAMDLDFIPIIEERYDLAILPELINSSDLEILLAAIKSDDFRNNTTIFGGYNLDINGQIIGSHVQ
jgi:putative molybdopterin biosynthesis protein